MGPNGTLQICCVQPTCIVDLIHEEVDDRAIENLLELLGGVDALGGSRRATRTEIELLLAEIKVSKVTL